MLGHKMFQKSVLHGLDVWGTLRGKKTDYPLAGIKEFQSSQLLEGYDVADEGRINPVLDELRPQVVVNCVGVIKQRPAAHEAVPAIRLNALLPHLLATKLRNWNGLLVQISTDCVFDGAQGLYTEDDVTNACDLYGRTKALGEVVERNALTLRTSIIGRELRTHTSLLDWFLSQGDQTISGYTRAWWSGVTTNHLSELILSIISEHPELRGLYNVSSGRMSKFDLLTMVKQAYRTTTRIKPDDCFLIDRSLDGNKLKSAIGYETPPWPELLNELVSDPTPYPTLKRNTQ
jgi:dTDP-4-dehydrorhamnose reductase